MPLSILVFFFWTIFFYVSAWLIKSLERRFDARVTGNRAQNVIVTITTTVLALYLIRAGTPCSRLLGLSGLQPSY